MNNTANGGGKLLPASMLIDSGMPVFSCKLNRAGDPLFPRDARWQETPVDPAVIDSYRDGRALCAVTGVVYDVLDIDPRNGGGPSFQKLFAELGRDLPNVIWKVETPSGGIHLYVDSLGIGSFTGFMPGLDLKGGLPDGTSRGFVFLPPTVRPSKDARKPGRHEYGYRDLPVVEEPEVCQALRDAILKHDAERKLSVGDGKRQDVSLLRTAAVEAQAGEQRPALLRLVHEYERKGYEASDIVTLLLSLGVRNFDSRKPWTARDFRGLLHSPGRVVGDATPSESSDLSGAKPVVGGLVRRFSEVERKRTSWIWPGYLARGEMTIMDGEKGVAKSLVTLDVAARLSTGRVLPGDDEGRDGKLTTIVFCSESSAETEIAPRLDAAEADDYYVTCLQVAKESRRGKVAPEWVLPDSASRFRDAIRSVGADIAIFDPINDFLAEDVQTNNDASIRRALGPLGRVLGEMGCAGWLIRHMNKDTGASARMRGAGTTAYQNRARVHLVVGRLPAGSVEGARYGVAIVDSNLRRVDGSVLAYDVIDSSVVADDSGGMVPMLEWFGRCNVDADSLVRGSGRRGPEPTSQNEIRMVLEEMFESRTTWPKLKVLEKLREAGCSTDPKTVAKVRDAMGIVPRRVARRGGGTGGLLRWDWTLEMPGGKVRVMDEGPDEGEGQ